MVPIDIITWILLLRIHSFETAKILEPSQAGTSLAGRRGTCAFNPIEGIEDRPKNPSCEFLVFAIFAVQNQKTACYDEQQQGDIDENNQCLSRRRTML